MFIEKLINKIKRDAIETGDPANWRVILSEKINSLLSPPEFTDEITIHILEQVENSVASHFNRLNSLSFTQNNYEKFKQLWHDCVHSGRGIFIFSTTDKYEEQSVWSAKNFIKYLEVTNKVKLYEPKQTDKFILSQEDGKGDLKNKQGIKFLASRGIMNLYQSGDELIANVDFFIQLCPVCSRYNHPGATLVYCPECDKLEVVAYPNVEYESAMSPEYDEDSRSPSNNKYCNDDWSDDDIDDIFEGNPDNARNVD